MKSSKALQDKDRLVKQIKKFFDEEMVEQIAHETKFVQRESKITGIDFFFLCVFAHQRDDEMSLEGLCLELLKDGKCISKQSLQERFNENAVCLMQQMVNELLSQKLNIKAIAHHPFFKRIIIGDSTAFQLPESFAYKYKGCGGGASNAGLKIQYSYDLISQKIIVMIVQNGTHPDNKQELIDVKKTIYELKIWAISK